MPKKKKTSTKVSTNKDIIKKALVEAMTKSLGIVTIACQTVGCARNTFYQYMKEDDEFADAINDIEEVALDFVESQLHKKIAGIRMVLPDGTTAYQKEPDTTAIIFYLKTKGKNRGYVERQEIVGLKEQAFFPYEDADYVDVSDD